MRQVHRFPAKLPVSTMQTYAIKAPRITHTRPATCEEVGCPQFLKGWITKVPIGSKYHNDLKQAVGKHPQDGIRRDGREITGIGSPEAEFLFNPGTPCFKASTHRKKLDRPELYLVRGGDWRANTGLIRRHTKPEHWVEDMQTTLDRVGRRAGVQ